MNTEFSFMSDYYRKSMKNCALILLVYPSWWNFVAFSGEKITCKLLFWCDFSNVILVHGKQLSQGYRVQSTHTTDYDAWCFNASGARKFNSTNLLGLAKCLIFRNFFAVVGTTSLVGTQDSNSATHFFNIYIYINILILSDIVFRTTLE